MNLPAEFSNRVIHLRKIKAFYPLRLLSEIKKSAPNSEIDVVLENGSTKYVLVFNSEEDCLAWKLKYGGKYD